ncbi:MAG: GTP-binding protein HSR1-related protein [archaeon GW2011_AR13]|nr:MAG: GTP-binding protein HSR1-related protein [archaeon GW2011_AR13]HIG94323.1 hypothetical protein [Nanoarchaeota archaeon]HIH62824.1 hypothetical protein [Nanoarchaeota archaeon]HIJ10038.1 hypothetical protein [Nanoarchaeota archaeon]
MRVQYLFSSRRTRRIAKIRKQRQKYPDISHKIVTVSDIILEVLDARFIKETRNIELETEIKKQKKKLIYVLNKSDLVKTKKVPKNFTSYVFISCELRKGIKELRDLIKMEAKKVEKKVNKIIKGDKIKDSEDNKIVVGIIGYPNTGKSSLINLLVGKNVAGTAAEAGFTKNIQKLRLTNDIVLLDSPGVIPEKEYSGVNREKIAVHAIAGGRSYSQVKDPDQVIANIIIEYPDVLEKYYNIDAKGNSEFLVNELGKQKGYLKKGGEVDDDKVSRLILKEWQEGKIKI